MGILVAVSVLVTVGVRGCARGGGCTCVSG